MTRLVRVQEHCWRLSEVLRELASERPDVRNAKNGLALSDAADWLDLASSVDKVEITTGRYDESTMWCRGAAEYEDTRSAALSEFAKLVTLFSFSWSAVEVLSQAVSWPQVPHHLRGGERVSDIERLIYSLHTAPALPPYDDALNHLHRVHAAKSPIVGFAPKQAKPFVGHSGEALNYIRQFRNAIAHGAAARPDGLSPVAWEAGQTAEGHVGHVALICTRLVLLSTQMLLLAQFGDEYVALRPRDRSENLGETAGYHLTRLHFE